MLDSYTHSSPKEAIFIHGAGGNNLVWGRTLDQLSGGEKARAVNLPGHPTGEITCKSVDDYSEAVHRFILEGGVARPAVCGHSMGGAIALTLALSHPKDVSSLILVSTGAKLGVLSDILAGLEKEPLRVIERTITPLSFYETNLEIARYARSALSISNPGIFLNDYLACKGFDVRDRLPGISCKTLILCGENDRMTPPRWSHYLHSRIPGSALYFVKEAGHMLPLEKPDVCGRLIESFLKGLNP